MKKTKLFTALVSPLAVGLPLVSAVSCSTINFTDTTYTEQNALIESQASKDLISSVWAKRTFANFYLKQILKVDVTKEKSDAIYNYLNDLFTKSTTVTFGSKVDKLTTNEMVYNDIYKRVFDSYKSYSAFNYEKDENFFTNKFTNLSTATDNPGWSDIMAWEIKDKKLIVSDTTIGEKLFDTDTNQYYFIVNSTNEKDKKWNTQFESDFQMLYRSQKTGIQKTVLEMMLTHLYFSASNEQFVKGGSDYNSKYDGYPEKIKTLEAWEMQTFNVTSPTYFFENYLVKKAPVFKWKINKTDVAKLESLESLRAYGLYDSPDLSNLNSRIHDEGDKSLNPNLMFKTSDSTLNQILNSNNNLFGFDYTSMSTGLDSPTGDLNFDRLNLINFTSEKSGFLDSYSTNEYRKNNLISFDQLKAMKLINKMPAEYSLPKISLDSSASSKSATGISAMDIRIDGIKLNDKKQWTDSKNNVFTLKTIIPQLNSENTKNKVKLLFSAKFINQDPSTKDKTPDFIYNFDVDIDWVTGQKINSDLNGEQGQDFGQFDSKSKYYVKKGIEITKEPLGTTPTEGGYSYYVRLLPEFHWDSNGSTTPTINIDGKDYPKGKFVLGKTLNITTKNSDDKASAEKSIQTLSNYFYLQDADLFNTSVKKAFVWNNYSLDSSDPTVSKVLQDLSLKTLLSSEREDKKLDKPFFEFAGTQNVSTISREEHLKVLNEQRK